MKKEKSCAGMQRVQEENRESFNKRRKRAITYEIGDLVAVKRTQFGPGLKLFPKYLGPYKVSMANAHNRYVLERQGFGEGPGTATVSADLMKPWKGYDDEEDSSSEEEMLADTCRGESTCRTAELWGYYK